MKSDKSLDSESESGSSSSAHKTPPMISIDEDSNVPLFGLDFLGILDRGTNVLEVKPITICNLHCKYCFVSAGDYHTNFTASASYLLKWIKKAIEIKKAQSIEVHLAPYGEILLHPQLEELIRGLRQIDTISTISMQTNGMLLNPSRIQALEEWGMDRLNISLNSMDAQECASYCGVQSYNLQRLLSSFDTVLESNMDLLIAPVWFRGINDQGIEDIVQYVQEKHAQGYQWPKLRLGLQNYLTYKTGRKIRKAKMRDFSFFYSVLQKMEKSSGLKLKLGPKDFGIFKTEAITPPVRLNEIEFVQILMASRWKNEYIARLNETWAVKVLSKGALKPNQILKVKFIRSSLHGNLLTAIPVN